MTFSPSITFVRSRIPKPNPHAWWCLCRRDGLYVLQHGFAVRIFNQLNTNPVGIGTDQPFSLKLGVIEYRTRRFDDTAAIVHDAPRHFLDILHPYGQMGEPQLVHRPPFGGSPMTRLLVI